jgi:DNA-binding NtrC family response regulator
MVDAPIAPSTSARDIEVAIVGAVDASLLIGLSANGIAAFAVTDEEPIGPETSVVYAPDASEAEIAQLAKLGPPVIAGIERDRITRLSALMRAGAADVAVKPVAVAELVRKIRRLARDRARGQRR